jgi:hypothetical protein
MFGWSLKGKLPHVTPKRFSLALCGGLVLAFTVYALAPITMPAWVHHLHIPMWFAKYWMFLAVSLVPIGAVVAAYMGWLEPRPDPLTKKTPNLPIQTSLTNKEYWPWLERYRREQR